MVLLEIWREGGARGGSMRSQKKKKQTEGRWKERGMYVGTCLGSGQCVYLGKWCSGSTSE